MGWGHGMGAKSPAATSSFSCEVSDPQLTRHDRALAIQQSCNPKGQGCKENKQPDSFKAAHIILPASIQPCRGAGRGALSSSCVMGLNREQVPLQPALITRLLILEPVRSWTHNSACLLPEQGAGSSTGRDAHMMGCQRVGRVRGFSPDLETFLALALALTLAQHASLPGCHSVPNLLQSQASV